MRKQALDIYDEMPRDMKRYLLYILTAMLSLAAVSCAQEEMFAPGELDDKNCYGVYFP